MQLRPLSYGALALLRQRAVLLCAVALIALSTSPAGDAGATSTTPTPTPIWKAYPLSPAHPAETSPAGARRGGTSAASGGGSGGGGTALQVGGGVLVVVLLGIAAAWLARRSQRAARLDPVSSPNEGSLSPAAGAVAARAKEERPRVSPSNAEEQTPVQARPVPVVRLRPRCREVIVDLLESVEPGGAGSAAPSSDDAFAVDACERIALATAAGEVVWDRAERDTFVWERATGSLAVRSVNGDARAPFELVVRDWKGSDLQALRASEAADGRLGRALERLYEAARDAASREFDAIDSVIDALRHEQRP